MAENDHKLSPFSRPTIGVHFFYVVLYLASVIVLLVAAKWTDLEGFTSYLSTAATITSLVLGVLAIIYSFVSSGAISQSLGSIESSTGSMRDVSLELRAISASARQIQERADERTTELKEIVTDLRSVISGLSERTALIAGTVEQLPGKFSELSETVKSRFSTSREIDDEPSEVAELWTEELASEYLARSSGVRLAVIKALNLAKERDTYCDVKRLFSTRRGEQDLEYAYGFVIASVSSGLISIEDSESDAGILRSTRLATSTPALKQALGKEWARRLAMDKKEGRKFFAGMDKLILESLEDFVAPAAPSATGASPASAAPSERVPPAPPVPVKGA